MNPVVSYYSANSAAVWRPILSQSAITPADIFSYQQVHTSPKLPGELHRTAERTRKTKLDRAPTGDMVRVILAVLSRWKISEDRASTILGSSRTSLISELKSGGAWLETRDMCDRARLLFDIYEGVFGLFREPQAERDWIRAQRSDLAGQSVLDLMTEGSQRNLIRALDFVDYINGR